VLCSSSFVVVFFFPILSFALIIGVLLTSSVLSSWPTHSPLLFLSSFSTGAATAMITMITTVVFVARLGAVKADTLLVINTDKQIDVASGSDFEFSFDISVCSQQGKEYIQVDLYDNGYSYGMDTSQRPDPMLMIARGQTVYPTASYNADWQKWSWASDLGAKRRRRLRDLSSVP
jgi:hypothetical protein